MIRSFLDLSEKLGKPRSEWMVGDLTDLFASRQIRVSSLMHVGGDGWLKTLDFVPRSAEHLADIIEAASGPTARASSRARASRPQPPTSSCAHGSRAPSSIRSPRLPTLVLMCGHAARDGSPLPQSPDTILRRAGDLLQAGDRYRTLGPGRGRVLPGQAARRERHLRRRRPRLPRQLALRLRRGAAAEGAGDPGRHRRGGEVRPLRGGLRRGQGGQTASSGSSTRSSWR